MSADPSRDTDTFRAIVAVFEQLLEDVDGFTFESRITTDLGADSLDVVQMATDLEQLLGLKEGSLDNGVQAWGAADGTVRELVALVDQVRAS